MTIGQTIVDLYLRAFNMAVVRHLGFFLKVRNFNYRYGSEGHYVKEKELHSQKKAIALIDRFY